MSILAKVNWKIILQILGVLLIIEGVFMMLGIPFSIYYCEDKCLSLLYSGLITGFTGLTLWFLSRRANRVIGKREGYIIVTFAWITISLFGTLPYLLSQAIPNFT
ncbi:MAG: TrkH family potassium uptake protein, partial [Bacteroidales bacterium]|nr:TrkH family potassium uptake protein [Bacteroidales bacterium]